MKKSLIVLTVAVSVVLAAGAVMPAISQPPEERTTISWFDPNKTDFEKNLNLGGKGFAGDMAIIKDTLLDPETCERSATLLVRFQAVKPAGNGDGFFLTDGGVMQADGKISFHFPGRFMEFEEEGGASGAVTGGTGAYRDVTGEIRITESEARCDRRGTLITADVVLQ